jgi:hypothetical protein
MRMMLLALASLVVIFTTSPAPLSAQDAAKAPTTAPEQPGPAKFYGVISAVDKTASTFTIDKQVYHVIAETAMTKADDSKATLDDAVVGEPARGTYTKTSDGTMNVTKVRFGKKAGGGKANGKKGAAKTPATQTDK